MWGSKTVFELHIGPKKSPLGPSKEKMTQKSCQNQMSKLKEAKKTKVVALYKKILKQFEPDPNYQNSLFLPQKSQQMTP